MIRSVLGRRTLGGVGGVDAQMERPVDIERVVLAYIKRLPVFGIDAQAAYDGVDIVGVGQAEEQWVDGGGMGVEVVGAALSDFEMQMIIFETLMEIT